MSSLVNRFKSGAGKAAFEADKLRRLQGAQSAIKPLRNEAERLYLEMGKLAYPLYTQGAISQPELRTAGERLVEMQAQIAAAEAEVERIRAEEFVEPLMGGASHSGLICPNGHGSLSGNAVFCQTCGAAGVNPAPSPATIATITCRQCGKALGSDSRFCPSCGTVVERCTNCGSVLLANALFCAECGTPTAAPPAENPYDAPGYESLDWPDQNT